MLRIIGVCQIGIVEMVKTRIKSQQVIFLDDFYTFNMKLFPLKAIN